jgi:hypothetical protein
MGLQSWLPPGCLQRHLSQPQSETSGVATADSRPDGTLGTSDYNFDGYSDLALETAFTQGIAS